MESSINFSAGGPHSIQCESGPVQKHDHMVDEWPSILKGEREGGGQQSKMGFIYFFFPWLSFKQVWRTVHVYYIKIRMLSIYINEHGNHSLKSKFYLVSLQVACNYPPQNIWHGSDIMVRYDIHNMQGLRNWVSSTAVL